MLLTLKKLLYKYREIVSYLFFGVLTTLVNFGSYAFFTRSFNMDEVLATAISFVLSVIFAFYTNRKWVFCSKTKGFKEVTHEFLRFGSGRVFSGVLDIIIMFVFVTNLQYNDMIVKILSNILIVIINFILSKIFVFRERK